MHRRSDAALVGSSFDNQFEHAQYQQQQHDHHQQQQHDQQQQYYQPPQQSPPAAGGVAVAQGIVSGGAQQGVHYLPSPQPQQQQQGQQGQQGQQQFVSVIQAQPTMLQQQGRPPPAPPAASSMRNGPMHDAATKVWSVAVAAEMHRIASQDPGSVSRKGHMMRTPMMCAARWGRVPAIEVLSSLGAPLEDQDVANRTALFWAIQYGRSEAVEALLRLGANVRHEDMLHATPLHYAVSYLQPEAVKMLLARGANPLAKDGKGLRPRQLLEKRQATTPAARAIAHLLGEAEGAWALRMRTLHQRQQQRTTTNLQHQAVTHAFGTGAPIPPPAAAPARFHPYMMGQQTQPVTFSPRVWREYPPSSPSSSVASDVSTATTTTMTSASAALYPSQQQQQQQQQGTVVVMGAGTAASVPASPCSSSSSFSFSFPQQPPLPQQQQQQIQISSEGKRSKHLHPPMEVKREESDCGTVTTASACSLSSLEGSHSSDYGGGGGRYNRSQSRVVYQRLSVPEGAAVSFGVDGGGIEWQGEQEQEQGQGQGQSFMQIQTAAMVGERAAMGQGQLQQLQQQFQQQHDYQHHQKQQQQQLQSIQEQEEAAGLWALNDMSEVWGDESF